MTRKLFALFVLVAITLSGCTSKSGGGIGPSDPFHPPMPTPPSNPADYSYFYNEYKLGEDVVPELGITFQFIHTDSPVRSLYPEPGSMVSQVPQGGGNPCPDYCVSYVAEIGYTRPVDRSVSLVIVPYASDDGVTRRGDYYMPGGRLSESGTRTFSSAGINIPFFWSIPKYVIVAWRVDGSGTRDYPVTSGEMAMPTWWQTR